MRFASTLVLIICLSGAASAVADEPITLAYYNRPPLKMTMPDGSVGGTTATAAAAAFTKAGVAFFWREMPAARLLAEIEQNSSRICGVGYHRTPERDRSMLITKSVDRETPTIAVAMATSEVQDGVSLDQLLGDPANLIEMKLSKSYGAVLDARLKRAKARVELTTRNYDAIMAMIGAGRPIITFMTEGELDYYVKQAVISRDAVRILHFPELAMGEEAHIICSKSVGHDVIERLDRAIDSDKRGAGEG